MEHRVCQAIALAEKCLHKGWSAAKLAERVNLSPSRFHQLFKDEMGMPPARYLRQLRLERARLLLETTHLSVKQVMAGVGVSDESHFVRDFKKAYGLTPARYRQNFLNSSNGNSSNGRGRPVHAAPPAPAAQSPAPPSSVSPTVPPLLLRRASYPLLLSADAADRRPPLREARLRAELLTLLFDRHTTFAELTTVITGNIVRGMTGEITASMPRRRRALARPRPPRSDFPRVPRRRVPRPLSTPALASAPVGGRVD